MENKSMCEKCGGRCCIGQGCAIAVKDLDTTDHSLEEVVRILLSTRLVTVDHWEIRNENNVLEDKKYYLRMRGLKDKVFEDTDDIEVPSRCLMHKLKGGCAFLYKNRPYGGRALVADDLMMCSESDYTNYDCYRDWEKSGVDLKALALEFISQYPNLAFEADKYIMQSFADDQKRTYNPFQEMFNISMGYKDAEKDLWKYVADKSAIYMFCKYVHNEENTK